MRYIQGRRRSGQAALEYMIIIIIGIILITPVIIEGNKKLADLRSTTASLKVTDALNRISDAAKLTYAQGVPAKIVLETEFPDKVKSVNITNKSIVITLETEWGDSDFVSMTDFNVTGDISKDIGIKEIKIESVYVSDKVWVNITEVL